MSRTATALPARLAAAVALTLVTLAGSVAVAGVAAADDAVPPTSSVAAPVTAPVAPAPVADTDDDDGDGGPAKVERRPVTYVDGDHIDTLGSLVAKKAPTLIPRFEAVAPQLRTALAGHLTRKGAQVAYDARGRLVIAPYLCDPTKRRLLQPGCVTAPLTSGDRF